MAGIGFALRRLARRESLSAGIQAHAHAAAVSCGPWLFTVAALGGIWLMSRGLVDDGAQQVFSIIVIYNFAFSLVLSGPIVFVVTRSLADRIYARDVAGVPGMLLGALALLFGLQALVAIPFYGFIVDMPDAMRLLAMAGFFLVGGIWLASAFLSALKSFETITLAFAVGMLAALALGVGLGRLAGATGMLAGVTIGLALVFYMLVARILAEYPAPVAAPFAFLEDFRRYWEFAVVGLVYNAAVWVDKWVMWMSPGRVVIAGAMPVHPAYHTGLFFAMLTIIPAMTLFLVTIETRFFEHYVAFYRDIGNHVTAGKIGDNHRTILSVLVESFRSLVVLQTAICYLAILLAPRLIELAGGGLAPVPIFRFAALGALFHVLLLFAMVVLFYFDLRRILVIVALVFFATNGLFTYAQVALGLAYPGYGYFLASVVSLICAYAMTARALARLPYMTFIGNNPGLH
jgi:polysaccharide biosynthesis protein PelG